VKVFGDDRLLTPFAGGLQNNLVIGLQGLGKLQQAAVFEIELPSIPGRSILSGRDGGATSPVTWNR
jgi:hypothetical protein